MSPLLDQVDGEIARVMVDGAYDGAPTYQTIAQHGDWHRGRDSAALDGGGRLRTCPPSVSATAYGKRSLVETAMGRDKALIGPRLRARGFAAQQTEAAIGLAVLNLAAGRPKSVRRERPDV